MLKFKMILEAIDRASAPVKRVRSSMSGLASDHRRLAAAERAGYATGTRLRTGLGMMVGSFRRAGAAARAAAGRAGLAAWTKATELAKRGTGALIGKVGNLASGMARWGLAAGAAAGGFALFDLFSTTAQFEQFQIMLEGIEGSSAAASKSFAWIKDFAAKTPYELAEVTQAFVSLRGAGLDPMAGSLQAAGDAAAGKAKPLMQAIEAVMDAVNGQYERLREFDITAAVTGDRVAFTYRKAGKEIVKTARKGAEVERVLNGIFTDRFGGMMVRQSTTFLGLINNLKDVWSNFLVMVGQAGIFDLVKGKIALILARVNEWAKNGKLKAWAENVSTWLEKAFNWAWQLVVTTNWNALVTQMQAIAQAAVVFAEAILKIAQNIGAITNAIGMFSGRGGQALITPTASGGKPYFERLKDSFNNSGKPAASTLSPALRGALADPVSLPGFAQPRGRQAANEVGGLIRIKLEAAPGTSARMASISSDNPRVPIRVELGRTMLGAA